MSGLKYSVGKPYAKMQIVKMCLTMVMRSDMIGYIKLCELWTCMEAMNKK